MEKILEKFESLQKEAEADLKVDFTDLENYFFTNLKIMKWMDKRIEWKKVFNIYEKQRKEKYRILYEFYKTDYKLKIDTKEEYALMIDSDSNYVELLQSTLLLKDIVTYIDGIVDILKGQQWQMKNYIEYIKYKAGK